ncbi:TonB-dependent receptor [Teredinibacter waterburyi]|uniref:TonB-dependent receptor n=1 Tax=Teredinibacter waterburyi TaxID=1500538 RepID=UPI00165F16A4|nr:TonB-dependent receptor [Teredinibacter waterburyi]
MTSNNSSKRPMSLRSAINQHNTFGRNALAVGVTAALGSVVAVADEEPILLDTMQIEERTVDTNPYAEPGVPYKGKESGDSRHVKPIADTPQTITVLTQTRIEESGKADMKDVLAQLPGITLGTGENGNAFGDRYVIRGYEARSDVYVDGMRDPGMTTRETFAAEQVEVTKGPSSTFAGRGSTGGAVNTITKKASTDYDFTSVDAGVGTDAYRRIALDSNKKVSETTALRANLMHSYKEIPDRGPADSQRLGALLSGSYAATDKLSLSADYYYLKAEDTPDLGSYFVDGTPLANPPVHLQEDRDFLNTKVGALTFKLDYIFNDNLRLENGFRHGSTENGYVTSNGGAAGTSSVHNGWQEVSYSGNQTNLFLDADWGEQHHALVFGFEYTDESVENGMYTISTDDSEYVFGDGPFGATMNYGLAIENGVNINRIWTGSVEKGITDSDYNIKTLSLYVMDTIDLTERLSLFAGVRYDDFDYSNNVAGFVRNSDGSFGIGDPVKYEYADGFWNGHASLVYDFGEDANVYVSYSTSTNINGGESDVGGSCGYGGICGDTETIGEGDPEQSVNLELGTKWEFFDEKLLVTGALFQVTKNDVMESNAVSSYETTGTYNTGKNRVEGIELSLTGAITEKLSAQFSATFMESEVLESYLDGSVEVASRNGSVSFPDNRGKVLANFADDSLNLQLRYSATNNFTVGAVATYSSGFYVGQPDAAAGFNSTTGEYSYQVPSYTVFDVFANYQINEQMKLRLNINNVSNEDYYTAAYRSGQFVYIGDRQNANLTFTYDF